MDRLFTRVVLALLAAVYVLTSNGTNLAGTLLPPTGERAISVDKSSRKTGESSKGSVVPGRKTTMARAIPAVALHLPLSEQLPELVESRRFFETRASSSPRLPHSSDISDRAPPIAAVS